VVSEVDSGPVMDMAGEQGPDSALPHGASGSQASIVCLSLGLLWGESCKEAGHSQGHRWPWKLGMGQRHGARTPLHLTQRGEQGLCLISDKGDWWPVQPGGSGQIPHQKPQDPQAPCLGPPGRLHGDRAPVPRRCPWPGSEMVSESCFSGQGLQPVCMVSPTMGWKEGPSCSCPRTTRCLSL